ncbi:MAG: rhodanese-like domain-containing protein [Rhodospirillaceae bacterium]|nr:MAG: rhodanese-like domain-containing protein [Rhodospirillaceae bacterium]
MALPPDQVFYVSPQQINDWRAKDEALIVDVREPDEWEQAHIPGAVFLPLSRFQVGQIPDPGSKHLVFHCRSGRRCGMAAEIAVAGGYKGVIKRMEGGFLAWSAAGYDSEPE